MPSDLNGWRWTLDVESWTLLLDIAPLLVAAVAVPCCCRCNVEPLLTVAGAVAPWLAVAPLLDVGQRDAVADEDGWKT